MVTAVFGRGRSAVHWCDIYRESTRFGFTLCNRAGRMVRTEQEVTCRK